MGSISGRNPSHFPASGSVDTGREPSYSYYGFRSAAPSFVGATRLLGFGLSALFRPYILRRGSLKGFLPRGRSLAVGSGTRSGSAVAGGAFPVPPFEAHSPKNVTLFPAFPGPVLRSVPLPGFLPGFLALAGWPMVHRTFCERLCRAGFVPVGLLRNFPFRTRSFSNQPFISHLVGTNISTLPNPCKFF